MDINGKYMQRILEKKIKKEIIDLKEKLKKTPKLVVLLIGEYARVKFMLKIKSG